MALFSKNKKQQSSPGPDTLKQASLFDEEHLLRVLIDNMPDHIYIKDTQSKFVLANKKTAAIHNARSPQNLIGKSDHDNFPKEMANQFYWDEQEIMSSGKPLINREEKVLDENGEDIYLSTTKIPLKNKEGKVIGLVGIGRDITDRKKAEQKLLEHMEQVQHVNTLLEEKQEEIQQQSEELSAQADNLSKANQELEKLSIAVSETDNVVVILDAEGNFEWVNKSFTSIYGYTLEQWIKEKGPNIIQGSHNPYIVEILAKCRKSGKTIRYQSEAQDKDGKTIWTQSTLTPLHDADLKIIRFVAIDSDITALKKAQDMINEQKKEMEAQRDQLEKVNITKDKFFSIIAHDLKNPFHSILGFSDLLVKNFAETEDDKKKEYLELIYESAQFANNLLENLLNWSRTQSETIKYIPTSFELYPLIEEVQHILHAAIGKKSINFQIKVAEDAVVYADNNMIQTVIRNLLSNAIKFTPGNGTITVEAIPYNDKLRISVSDTGVGIPKDLQEKLLSFNKFLSTQGTAGEPGTGLGLIICNDFIKKHGDELIFTSIPGRGTTFSFDLYRQKP